MGMSNGRGLSATMLIVADKPRPPKFPNLGKYDQVWLIIKLGKISDSVNY
jgi:hypothetical protein